MSNILFRNIKQSETEQAINIENICFPPNEADKPESMRARIAAAPELFLVAEDIRTGLLAGFLNGISTAETAFRDEFFTDTSLYDPDGETVMIVGLDVLPEYRGKGIARELMSQYCLREKQKGRKRLVLTCLEPKVEMYLKMGFTDNGTANSSWGGEIWHEMSREL